MFPGIPGMFGGMFGSGPMGMMQQLQMMLQSNPGSLASMMQQFVVPEQESDEGSSDSEGNYPPIPKHLRNTAGPSGPWYRLPWTVFVRS